MKKVSIFLAILLFAASAMATDWTMIGGCRYETDLGLIGTVGLSRDLGQGWKLIGYGDFGQVGGSGNAELAWLRDFGIFSLGFFAGPNADVQNIPEDDQAPITYLIGSAGLLGTLNFNEWGIWTAVKRKMSLDASTQFQNENIFGAGVYMGF